MARRRPTPPLTLNEHEKDQLRSIARARSLPHGIMRRAQIVPACAAGETHAAIARLLGVSNFTVGKWRRRYLAQGLADLHDECACGPGAHAPTTTSASQRSSTPLSSRCFDALRS